MKFVDSTIITTQAGKGGDGVSSFRTARGRAKLGPDGGDGGDGGSVILRGNCQINTLSRLRYKQLYKAEEGVRGGTNGCTGRRGKNKIIEVPLGSIIFDEETNRQIGEILTDAQELIIAEGGIHGKGNLRWLTSTHQAPREYTCGEDGEEKNIRIELKLIADVGLAGFPNAGKSTLISAISAARPKIADYPFTTLTPNLGVVDIDVDINNEYEGHSMVVADIPGLIEGASEGKGLGHEFLRHLERTKVILYVIDSFSEEDLEPVKMFKTLKKELSNFSSNLGTKQFVIALSKTDVAQDGALEKAVEAFENIGHSPLTMSAVSGKGLTELKREVYSLVTSINRREVDAKEREEKSSDFDWQEILGD